MLKKFVTLTMILHQYSPLGFAKVVEASFIVSILSV